MHQDGAVMRTYSKLGMGLAIVLLPGFGTGLCEARSKDAGRRKVSDFVARPVTAALSDLTFDESALNDQFSLFGSPYQAALDPLLPPQSGCLLRQQALIIHFANWDAFGTMGP